MAKSSLPVGGSQLPPARPQFAGKGWLERDTQLAGPSPLRIIMEIFESVKERIGRGGGGQASGVYLHKA